MNDFDKIYEWETMSVSGIIGIMVKWLNISHVEFTTEQRHNVESGIWYCITAKDEKLTYLWSVSAQKQELLRTRLIQHLDKIRLREDYLKRKSTLPQTDK